MKNKKWLLFDLFIIVWCFFSSHANANTSTAICASVENNPAAKDMLLPPPDHIEGFTPYIYKSINGVDLRLHVLQSNDKHPNSRKKSAILFFYGGAWEYGTVKEFVEPAKYFSARGAVSILVDYRVFCRNGNSIADEVSDAKSAVRYIRKHAKSLGIDPHHIAVSGGSAGGHLALSTATIDGFESSNEDLSVSSKPNLLALFYPCSDVTTDDEKSYGGDAIGVYGKDVSPLYHIHKGLPSTLIIQGTDDIVYEENKKLCAQSTAIGNECEFTVYEGAPHGYFSVEVEGGKWYKQALTKADNFLTKAGYLSPQ